MKFVPRRPHKNVNITPTSPLRDFLVMLGGLVVVFVSVYVLLGLGVDLLVPRISPEMEKRLGGYLQVPWTGTGDFPEQEAQVQELLDRIQQRCGNLPYQLDVMVAESQMINALALPGGRVVVLTGLLENVRSENELAFVLGHEMGHFESRDHLSELGRGLIFMALSAGVFGPDSSLGKKLGRLLQVSELSFSRKHETMADEYALDIQNCVYGHVAGATDFFEHAARLEEKRFTGHYLSTHPESARRISRLNDLAVDRAYERGGEKIPVDFKFKETEKSVPGD